MEPVPRNCSTKFATPSASRAVAGQCKHSQWVLTQLHPYRAGHRQLDKVMLTLLRSVHGAPTGQTLHPLPRCATSSSPRSVAHLAVEKNVAAPTQNHVFDLLKHTPSARYFFSTQRCFTKTWDQLMPCALKNRNACPPS